MRKMMMVSTMVLSLLIPSIGQAAVEHFPDVEGHWAQTPIQWAMEAGVVKGYKDGTFKPNALVTEAEFLAMLFKAFPSAQRVEIPDPKHWSDSVYLWAKQYRYPAKGLIQPADRNLPIKRQQVAEILSAANGMRLSGDEAVRYVLDHKLARGKVSHEDPIAAYKGNDPLTRAEAVQFILNAIQNGLGELKGPSPDSDRGSVSMKQWDKPPVMAIDPDKHYQATLATNKGDIVIELFAKDAPKTVNNFIFLAKENFYNNVLFHRVIKDFMIQSGDPTGTGAGGPGYRFEDELPSPYRYEKGIVAMANAGANTNGSQFFICNGIDSEYLNKAPHYTIFGRVIAGMDVVEEISSVKVEMSSRGEASAPTEEMYIKKISIEEKDQE